jgi:hypothetical protein
MSQTEAMKLVHISVHFEYSDLIDAILDRHGVVDYVRYPMVEGRDSEGRHFGTQVFPGNFTAFQAQVADERLDGLLTDLREFRDRKPTHGHLQAAVLPIERML